MKKSLNKSPFLPYKRSHKVGVWKPKVFLLCPNCMGLVYSHFSGHFNQCDCGGIFCDETPYYCRVGGHPIRVKPGYEHGLRVFTYTKEQAQQRAQYLSTHNFKLGHDIPISMDSSKGDIYLISSVQATIPNLRVKTKTSSMRIKREFYELLRTIIFPDLKDNKLLATLFPG